MKKHICTLLVLLAAGLLLCGCSGSEETTSAKPEEIVTEEPTEPEEVADEPESEPEEEPETTFSVALSNETLELVVGENFQLKYRVTPVGETIWESDDPDVASVSENGEVSAVGAGICVVTLSHGADIGAYARCVVTVREAEEPEEEPQEEQEPEEPEEKRLIAVDAGHQATGDSGQEPLGPGSGEMKARVSSGTRGVSTGTAEYELNLEVSLKLQEVLEARGYEVLMIRTTNDVSVSNAERAQMANEAGADALIRIHADGSEDSGTSGAMTICMTSANPYNAYLYEASRELSQILVDKICAATGANNRGVWETDTMTGINWAEVPVTIVEMGFMTNPTEDQLLATDEYQYKIANAIADGLDRYFER